MVLAVALLVNVLPQTAEAMLIEEGMNFFSSRPPPKLRPKSAGGNRMRPRPNTIHVDNRYFQMVSSTSSHDTFVYRENDVTGSQNNITMYRSLTRGESSFRRGSNVSLHDGGSGWSGSGSGDMRSLSMFSRSKSSSASNLGPNSLQLGLCLSVNFEQTVANIYIVRNARYHEEIQI